MNDDLEGRLRARAAREELQPVLSDAARRATQARLALLAARDVQRSRSRWIVAAVAAAAVVLALLFPRGEQAPSWSPVEAEVALLDGFGRPLQTRVRSTQDPQPRPASLLVEVLAPTGTHVAIAVYDAHGQRAAGYTGQVAVEDELLHEIDLAPLPALDEGPTWVSVVVVTTDAAAAIRLPERHLPGDSGRDQALALELGDAAQVRSFILQK